jgi:hypothetical protein
VRPEKRDYSEDNFVLLIAVFDNLGSLNELEAILLIF